MDARALLSLAGSASKILSISILMLSYLSNGAEISRNEKPHLPSCDPVRGESKQKAFQVHGNSYQRKAVTGGTGNWIRLSDMGPLSRF